MCAAAVNSFARVLNANGENIYIYMNIYIHIYIVLNTCIAAHSAGTVEYTDCFSEEG